MECIRDQHEELCVLQPDRAVPASQSLVLTQPVTFLSQVTSPSWCLACRGQSVNLQSVPTPTDSLKDTWEELLLFGPRDASEYLTVTPIKEQFCLCGCSCEVAGPGEVL